jgi:hypothetical protein
MAVMRTRWRGQFRLVRQFGELAWQGLVAPTGRSWHIRIPYPLTGAFPAGEIDYPRIEVAGLSSSPHRIGEFLCVYYPWDTDPSRVWTPPQGIARLLELACIWLATYEAWLRAVPGPGQFPSWMFGQTLFGSLVIDESNTPSWPGLEAPHGRPRPKRTLVGSMR